MQKNTLAVDLPVCLDVLLSLKDTGRYSRGDIVRPKDLPTETASMADYLASVFPSAKVEFLGRPSILCLRSRKFNPTSLFFHTVHHCFQNHYPLALRPEVLMYLIVNEVATTVNMYPEQYRHLFTKSKEKVRLDVRNDALRKGDPVSPWHEVLEYFGDKLQEYVPSDLMPSFLPNFSTSSVETNAATIIAFMSTVREYYDYHTHTLCGLPRIRLMGKTADYAMLYESAERLSRPFQAHLGPYFENLLPVLRKLEQQASGAPIDTKFWSSIYKFSSESGTATFNGWIAAFVNYIQTAPRPAYGDKPARPGTLEPKKADLYDWTKEPSFRFHGIDIGSVPSQISVAPFAWHYFEEEFLMQFVGGVLGVDDVDGYAAPALSYAIMNSE